jgi:hypothetical protein
MGGFTKASEHPKEAPFCESCGEVAQRRHRCKLCKLLVCADCWRLTHDGEVNACWLSGKGHTVGWPASA